MDGIKGRLKEVRLKTPVRTEDLRRLEPGNVVYLDGVIYTGREGVYKKVVDEGLSPPEGVMELTNVNFHCSPAAAVRDDGSYNIGAVTGTASFRFSRWMKDWFEISGARMIIGKGGMSETDYKTLFVPVGAVYLCTVG